MSIIFKDIGLIGYKEAWDYQENLLEEVIKVKLNNKDLPENKKQATTNYLLFCEHHHVYTLGKSGSEDNLLINHIQLNAKNATFCKTNRGGDITYHGPGQIVGYPIFDLESFYLGVKEYVFKLENSIINSLKEYGIESSRLSGATGVWLDSSDKRKARKICAIGIRVSRYVSMHGFAFNVNTDLSYFNHINPCGFIDKGVTSLEKELNEKLNIEDVKEVVKNNILKEFDI